jgi:hypothetical protein
VLWQLSHHLQHHVLTPVEGGRNGRCNPNDESNLVAFVELLVFIMACDLKRMERAMVVGQTTINSS